MEYTEKLLNIIENNNIWDKEDKQLLVNDELLERINNELGHLTIKEKFIMQKSLEVLMKSFEPTEYKLENIIGVGASGIAVYISITTAMKDSMGGYVNNLFLNMLLLLGFFVGICFIVSTVQSIVVGRKNKIKASKLDRLNIVKTSLEIL